MSREQSRSPNTGLRAGGAPRENRSRTAYCGWCMFLALLMSGTLAVIGLGLDGLTDPTAGILFASFTTASLLGVFLAAVFVWPWIVLRRERLALLVLLLVAWRCSYFPLLLGAAAAAGTMAGLSIRLPLVTPTIYPAFLMAFGLMQLGVGLLATWPVVTRRLPWGIVCWPPLVLCGMASFCGWEDFHPLPDRGYASLPAAAQLPSEGGLPERPHPLTAWGWNARVRFQVVRWAYAGRHSSPWSRVVQGTLVGNLRRGGRSDRPAAAPPPGKPHRSETPRSTARFIRLFYSALLAAHEFVGSRQLTVRRERPPEAPGSAELAAERSALERGMVQLERKRGSW